MSPSSRTGVLAAALAYTAWGIFPLYLKQVAPVGAVEVVVHRSLWSLVFVFGVLVVLRRLDWLRVVARQPRTLAVFAASAALLSLNWALYVWAVGHDRIVDASLGYFINPLVNVLLGVWWLRERPRPLQWAAVALAALGVLWLVVAAGEWPWVAVALALSFGTYGLLRKTAPLGAIEGLGLETLLQAPFALALLAWWMAQGTSAFQTQSAGMLGWLLAAGPFTAVPLLLFAAGARRLTLATLGLMQYLGPSLQFVLGVFVYGEPFGPARAAGFAVIWVALAFYTAESLWWLRQPGGARRGAD